MVFNQISKKGLIVAATTFGSRIISSTFNFYYVKVVLDRYHMTQAWFQLSQMLFAIWNAINDPWFGYLQDNSPGSWISVRRKCILYGALPWVLSFLIPFFPWSNYTSGDNSFLCFVQGLTSLCLFDTFFTFCLLAHCALMTEYAESDQERLTLVKYMGVAGIVGSSSVFFSNYFSVGLSNYGMFQFTCAIQAILALGLFSITGLYAATKYDQESQRIEPTGSYWKLTKDIFKNRNFLSFVAVNFMQELHITYVMSFAKIFSEQMIPESQLSNSGRSFLLGALMVLPQVSKNSTCDALTADSIIYVELFYPFMLQVAVVVLSPLVSHIGVYTTVMWSFYLKIVIGLLMFISGTATTVWFLIFLVIDL